MNHKIASCQNKFSIKKTMSFSEKTAVLKNT